MRRFFCNRFTVIALLALAACYWIVQQGDAANGALILAGIDWVLAGFPSLLRLRRANRPRETISRVRVRASWGRRERDLGGCVSRLDPAWQQWLRPNSQSSLKENHHAE